MKKYKLIANPATRRGNTQLIISRTLELLAKRGVSYDLELTAGPKEAGKIARAACRDHDVIIAIGGDGTVNEVVQGMVFSDTPLGIIPGGTGNDFVRSLHIPNRLEQAVDIVLAGQTRKIDVGKINGTYFANNVGFGFDAAVNITAKSMTGDTGGLSLYVRALIGTLGKYRPVQLTIAMNNRTIDQETFLLSIGNGTTCGGGFKLTPHAMLDDQLLDVTLVKPLPLASLLWHFPKVFLGTIDRVSYASHERTSELTIRSNGPVPIHVDGEIFPGDETSYTISIVPRALTVIVNPAAPYRSPAARPF
jgi:YegS/Rv2252/BmrU family lipid kinase